MLDNSKYYENLKKVLVGFDATGNLPPIEDFGYFEIYMGLCHVLPNLPEVIAVADPAVLVSMGGYTYKVRRRGFRQVVTEAWADRYNAFIDAMGVKFEGKLQPTQNAQQSGDDAMKAKMVGIRRVFIDLLAVALKCMDVALFRNHLVAARTCGIMFVEGKPESEMPRIDTPIEKGVRPASYPPGFLEELFKFLDENLQTE